MTSQPAANSIDEYIAEFPPETQRVLAELRTLIRGTVPNVTERISYAIPTFDLNGQYLVYLAGWKEHISLYPITASLAEAFGAELKPYLSGKGTLKFPLSQPMPLDLIRRLVLCRVAEVSRKEMRSTRRGKTSSRK